MVCYSQVAKAYRLYNANDYTVNERRDVIFEENEFDSDKTNELEITKEDYLTIVIDNSNEQQKDDNLNQITPSANGSDIQSGDESEDLIGFETAEESEEEVDDQNENTTACTRGRPKIVETGKRGRLRRECLNNMVQEGVSLTVKEAMNGVNKESWCDTMKAKIASLGKNETRSLGDLPNGAIAIDSKRVFALEKDDKGNIKHFKTRLVAKGCSQRYWSCLRADILTSCEIFDDTLSNGISSSVQDAFTSDRYK